MTFRHLDEYIYDGVRCHDTTPPDAEIWGPPRQIDMRVRYDY